MHIDYPFHVSGQKSTATTGREDHVRDLIEQVLFTTPGERVNRPDFGCNLMQLVFAPNSDELATATQFLVQGALQQWLGDLIKVQQVQVQSDDSTLRISVDYVLQESQQSHSAEFSRET